MLWAGWLIPMGFYFTFTAGLWHAYYLIMLGPAIAALVGAGWWALGQLGQLFPRGQWLAATAASAATVGFELFILSPYPAYFPPTAALMVILLLAGLAWLWVRPRSWAPGLVLVGLLVGPALWSSLAAFNPQPDVDLPKAGPQAGQPESGASLSPMQAKVLDYLLTHTTGLQPNTRYYYRLRCGGAAGAEQAFTTQRAPGSTFTFDIQGDSHPLRPSLAGSATTAPSLRATRSSWS